MPPKERTQSRLNLEAFLERRASIRRGIELHSFAQAPFFMMSIDRRKATIFGAAAAVRLLLFTAFPGLPDLLTARVEISTPVTSFKRCKIYNL
jgi:hypothetical protein